MNGLHRSHLAVGDKELVLDSFEGSRKQKAHQNSLVSTNNSRHYCSFILVGCGMEFEKSSISVIEDDDDTNVDSEKELSVEQKLELVITKKLSTNQNTVQKSAIYPKPSDDKSIYLKK
ncbi:hypothetical protein TNCV_1854241 [Trichonephila clavipes]|nr:hypothetical protein TNCV_1854241 [Trichonephila clavipes]